MASDNQPTPKAPVDVLLDAVTWAPVERTWAEIADADASGVPYATHAGTLEIAGHRLKVYQLNDGRRVIEAGDVERFFMGDDEGE